MTVDRPPVEYRQPGVLVTRYEWPEHLEPSSQRELLDLSLTAAKEGPVALVFVMADRLRAIPPTVRGFWRTTCSDPALRIAAIAVVTSSWSVEVATAGFEVTNSLSGASVAVGTFGNELEATEWASSVVRRPAVASNG